MFGGFFTRRYEGSRKRKYPYSLNRPLFRRCSFKGGEINRKMLSLVQQQHGIRLPGHAQPAHTCFAWCSPAERQGQTVSDEWFNPSENKLT